MAELFLGGLVDPATHERTGDDVRIGDRRLHDARRDRRHDRVGQDRPRRRAHRGGAAGRAAGAADRPEGRPHQPLPHVPGPAPRPTSGRGSTTPRPRRPACRPTSSPPSRRRRGPRASPAGASARPTSPRCGRRRTSRSTRRARSRACRSTSSARCRCRPTRATPRSSATRSRATSSGLLGLVGIEADPLSSREHILLVNLIHHSWSAGHAARPADARRDDPAAADPQARRVRARPVLPAGRPHDAGDEAQRPARVAVVRGVGRWAPRSTSSRCCTPPTARPRCAIVTTAHLSDEERQFVTSLRPVQARHVDAPPERHHRPAGAALHGRGRRLPAADRQPADEEADHAADEAGACVRRRRRADDAEPGRRRLQGAVQRRHVDDRPAADRPRQAAPARRHERGERRASTSAPSATRSAGSPSASSCCAAPARTSPRCSPRAGR